MTTLRSTRRNYASALNGTVVYAPLLLFFGMLIMSLPAPSAQSTPGINLTGFVIALGAAGASLVYASRLSAGRAALTRRLQESDELNRMVTAVTSADTFAESVAIVLRAFGAQFTCTSAAFISVGADRAPGAWRLAASGILERIDRESDGSEDLVGERYGLSCVDLGSKMRDLERIVPACRAALTVPITLPGSARIGLVVLGFDRKRSFGCEERRWLSVVSRGVALPLERVRMQDEMRRLAYTDPMTGIANYRAFRSYLRAECRRAGRYEHAPSLLIMDIDWFKSINDRFGHPVGDDVLRHVSALVQYHLRSIDIPARYGGEEFAILCPETDLEAAVVLAERLRCAIELAAFQLPTGDRLSVTVSIGVARYQHGTGTEEELISAADAALYQSKRMGRNLVQTAGPVGACTVSLDGVS
jgi:diguanylate cyclase (GGDEF)-like protein